MLKFGVKKARLRSCCFECILQNVDVDKELIYKQSSGNVDPSSFNDQISKERASYHVYNYSHRYNDEDTSSTCKFTLITPGYFRPKILF